MSIISRRKTGKILAGILLFLVTVCIGIVIYVVSPLNPGNVPDEKVARNGIEYTVELIGISTDEDDGFLLVTKGFYFTDGKVVVYKDDDGYARTSYTKTVPGMIMDGRYSSAKILYEDYNFCGQTYKNKEELRKFFATPDRIYDFDINKLSEYVQDILNYEKKFYGKATVKIYRGKCVITDVYIGDEKVLEYKL